MALRGQSACRTFGNAGCRGGTNAQCVGQFAPSSIQRRNNSICAVVSRLPVLEGGIRLAGSSLPMRATRSLSAALPGTIAGSAARVDEASPPRTSTANQGRVRRDGQVLMAKPWKLRQDNGAGDAHCNKVSSKRKDRDEADQRGLDCGATSSVACRSLR